MDTTAIDSTIMYSSPVYFPLKFNRLYLYACKIKSRLDLLSYKQSFVPAARGWLEPIRLRPV